MSDGIAMQRIEASSLLGVSGRIPREQRPKARQPPKLETLVGQVAESPSQTCLGIVTTEALFLSAPQQESIAQLELGTLVRGAEYRRFFLPPNDIESLTSWFNLPSFNDLVTVFETRLSQPIVVQIRPRVAVATTRDSHQAAASALEVGAELDREWDTYYNSESGWVDDDE